MQKWLLLSCKTNRTQSAPPVATNAGQTGGYIGIASDLGHYGLRYCGSNETPHLDNIATVMANDSSSRRASSDTGSSRAGWQEKRSKSETTPWRAWKISSRWSEKTWPTSVR